MPILRTILGPGILLNQISSYYITKNKKAFGVKQESLKQIYSVAKRASQSPRGSAGVCPLKGATGADESTLNASLCDVTTMPAIWD